MYYGSSIVRSMGLIMLMTPFIGKERLQIKDIFIFGITSLALMSKSSIALPVIIISMIVIILMYLIKDKSLRKLSIICVIIAIGISFCLGNNEGIASVYKSQFLSNIKSVIIFSSLIIIAVAFLLFNFKPIFLEVCGYVFLLFSLTLIEPINNIFEKISIFDFVACRFLTSIFIFIIMLSTFCVTLFIKKMITNVKLKYYIKNIILISLSTVLFFGSLLAQSGLSFKNLNERVSTFKNNKYFAPQSVIVLGDCLEKLSKEKKEKLYAIMPEGIGIDGYTYSLAISIRQFSPSIVSLSAYTRYPGTIEKDFKDYSSDNQKIFDEFLTYRDQNSINNFKDMLNEYPINCVVTLNCVDDEMRYFGMKKYTSISYQNSYYIYYR